MDAQKPGAKVDDLASAKTITTTHLTNTSALLIQPAEVINATPQIPTIDRVKFSMGLLDRTGRQVHMFTSMRKEIVSVPKELMDISDVWVKYPPLADYYRQGPINSPIFLFEAYLNVRNYLPEPPLFFAVEFTIEFAERLAFDKWQSSTRIYGESNNGLDHSKDAYFSRPGDDGWEYLEFLELPQTDKSQMAIPFKSKWWSDALIKIILERCKAEKSGDPEVINHEDEKIRHRIEGISIIQEIWATPRYTDSPCQRMAIFLWKFKETQRINTATTSWRPIRVPVFLSQQTQPLPSLHQDCPNTLGANAHSSSMPVFPAPTLANNAKSLFENSPITTRADALSLGTSTPIFEGIPNEVSMDREHQESFLPNYYSGAHFPSPPEPCQPVHEVAYPEGSLQHPKSNSSDPQDILWPPSNPFDGTSFLAPLEPWNSQGISQFQPFQPQENSRCGSQDFPWPSSSSFGGDPFLTPPEPWHLQEPFQPQESFQSQDRSPHDSWTFCD